jgi:surfeit locus 1 family protein
MMHVTERGGEQRPPTVSSRARLVLLLGLLGFAAIAIRLGIWQLHRRSERLASNAATLAQRNAPELDVAARGAAPLADRRVRVSGVYDRTHELVLRTQALRELPGVILVTPLRIPEAGDTAVLVERGFVPSPDAVTLPPAAAQLDEPGTQRVHGVAIALTTAADKGAPLVHAGATTWKRLDLAALRRLLPYPILDVVIRQTPDSSLPQMPRRREPATLDEGPHLSYAIQWFAFATIAVVFGGIFWRRGRR